jgi:predicted nucleic acid-binding protein
MIFDSSIWIDFFRGRKSDFTDLLDGKLAEFDTPDVYLCPSILQEVLQGINDSDDAELIKNLLFSCKFLLLDSYWVAEKSAEIYRNLRKKGITINKPNDCIIAFYAIHFDIKLAHNDKDFDKIAKHTSLKVF